jgi:hypothetical protein
MKACEILDRFRELREEAEDQDLETVLSTEHLVSLTIAASCA